jgi:streptogramin lyase
MLVLLLTLVGLLGGCGASTTTGSSHSSGPTPTTTRGLKGMISEFLLPSNSFAASITTGRDGNLWFIEPGKIGRITSAGQISEFPMPTPSSNPGGITTGPDDALWFTEYQSNKIGRLT